MYLNEADTRAKLIDPAIHKRGWTEDLIRREETAGTVEIVNGDDFYYPALHFSQSGVSTCFEGCRVRDVFSFFLDKMALSLVNCFRMRYRCYQI